MTDEILSNFLTPRYMRLVKKSKVPKSEWAELQRQGLISTAAAMASNKINFVEGIRYILHYANELEISDDPVFLGLRGVDSEVDGYPIGAVRAEWLPESLNKIDQEISDYISKVRKAVLEDCQTIIAKFSIPEDALLESEDS